MLKKLITTFVISRILFIFLPFIIYYFKIIESYDESSSLQESNNSLSSIKFFHFLKLFNNYDTIHFIHIASKGYTNLKNFAFFPLFPKLLLIISGIFQAVIENEQVRMLFVGLIFSNILCLINAILLFKYLNLIKGLANNFFSKQRKEVLQ